MKRRSESILRRFVTNSHAELSVSGLRDEFGVSDRTLRNDLAEIGLFLRDLGLSGIRQNDAGRLVVDASFDVRLVGEALRSASIRDYKLSPEERRFYAEVVLLWDGGYVTMQGIADELFVSRVTILKDFDVIKDEMAERGVEVVSDAGKGVRASCSTDERLSILLGLMRDLTMGDRDRSIFQRLVMSRLNVRTSFGEVYELVRSYLAQHSLAVVDDRLFDLVLFMFLLVNVRLDQDGLATPPLGAPELDGLLGCVCMGSGCQPTEEMFLAFGHYIGSNDVGSFVRRLDEVEFFEMIVSFLTRIDATLGTRLSTDELLIESLRLHLEDARDWGDLDFEFSREDAGPIDYDRIADAVGRALPILERYLAIEVGAGLRRSIILHICVALIRDGGQGAGRLSVVVTCPGSMVTGRYLETQLRSYFDFDIVAVVRESDLAGYLKRGEHVDLVVSTVPLGRVDIPYVVVHAVLSMQDMDTIRKAAAHALASLGARRGDIALAGKRPRVDHPQSQEAPDPLEVLDRLREEGQLDERLYAHLCRGVRDWKSLNDVGRPTAIGSLLDRSSLRVDDSVPSWSDGIRAAGQILVDRGSVGRGYVEKAVENVERFGDYVVLRPGIALAHAGRTNGVNADDLSLLVSHAGIPFTDPANRVHLLFFLAIESEKDYEALFNEILSIGDRDDLGTWLSSLDEDALYRLLCVR